MENDTTLTKQGLLEPVLPGSVTFDNSILGPLQNNYLYEESKECFSYSSAYLINNATLQERYSAFRAEKQEKGYSKEELEEFFGFLLFDDESTANKLADTGLMVGQGTCTTLGDSSKGVYISKYSDCLDLKRWYDGKTGYIVLLKLTKGRVKEVTENYTQNFTRPTAGFDCHVSEQFGAVCATTSSFLAFERTQYYMYELLDRGRKAERCPRHVCPFAIVAFSYGKTTISLELKETSQEKKPSFHYQPWSGQLKIESVVYDIGLKSVHGAMFPANLPKTVKVDRAIGVSELRQTLPQAVFETSVVGEVSLDGRSFSLYDVVSFESSDDLSVLTHELKEKDMALVICLDDGGFLLLLHSSHFFSYEGAGTDKASTLQGMFIFPDSRSVPRETKSGYIKPKLSPEVFQALPALNYAESEMEKCPSNQQGEPLGAVEKHLQNFATLILPGLSSSPVREASMFPDQYDVPDGFPLVAPKWTEGAGARLKAYLENPCGFRIPVARALELLAAGKQQRSDDDHDDDVYYYISSPEEAPHTPADAALERDVTDEADPVSGSVSDEVKATDEQQVEKQKDVAAELAPSALPEEGATPGTVVVATTDSLCERTDPSPKSGDLPEHCVDAVTDSEKMSQSASINDECSGAPEESSQETPVETASVPLTECSMDLSAEATKADLHSEVEAEGDASKPEDCRSDVLPKDGVLTPVEATEVSKEAGLPTSISVPPTSENQTEALVDGSKQVQQQETSVSPPKTKPNLKRLPRHYRRRKKRGLRRNVNKVDETPTSVESTSLPSCSPVDSTPEQSGSSETVCSSPSAVLKKDWRSLPRRKRLWNADVSTKRVLRSNVKSSDTESFLEESPPITELRAVGNILTSTPKRKESFSMRERYGLKTIITECGRVFVPHGSEVATGDIKSPKDSKDSSLVMTTSPTNEKPADISITSPPSQTETHISMNTPVKSPSSQQIVEKDTTSQNISGQSSDSDPKKSKAKENLYKAISISKLKTVLKRAKKARDSGKSASDNAEPDLKKARTNTGVDLKQDSPHKNSKALQNNPELAGSEEPSTPVKETTVSRRELKILSSPEKLMPKENGCISIDISAPNAIVKQADQQLVSALTEDRVGKIISAEGKSSKGLLATGVSLPSDALNLLADLALSANSGKMLPFPAKPKQETRVGVKTSNLPESVLHALLRSSSARLKLPPKSPFPEGLVVPGDFMLEISKEHSYSQPTSLLPGLSGTCSPAPPPAGRAESLLSLNPKLQLKLPDHTSGTIGQDKGGKNGWRQHLDGPPTSALKAKGRKPKFSPHRRVLEKEGSIQVGRVWSESYDFRFDSRFTNDQLEKSVTRALHGNWDFSIEDTYEQVHLIFHMWIGLFYSKPTSRFFHFDHNCPPLEKTDPPKVPDVISLVQATVQDTPPVSDAVLSSKGDKTVPLQSALDILDLSVKAPGPSDHCIVSQGSSGESPTASSDKALKVEQTGESKEPADRASSSQSSTVATKLNVTDYRSTGNILEEGSAPDDDYSDMDNDTVADSSYTKVLENNSAYSHLCQQASNMRIGEQKNLKVATSVLVCKDQGMPEVLRIKGSAKEASGTVTSFDPKAVAVFHKVVRPVGPVLLSKAHDQASERKIILSSLSLKDKIGGGAPEARRSESVSKDKSETALPGKNSELIRRDDASMSVQKVNEGVKENVEEDTPMSVDIHNVVEVNRKEVKPTRADKPILDSRNADATERINTDETNDKDRPGAEDRDETPDVNSDVSRHDMKNETPHGVRDKNDEGIAKDGVKPAHDVEDSLLVDIQDGNDNAKDEVKSTRDIGDSAPVSEQDVKDKTKEEAAPSTSVNEHRVDKVEGMEVHEVINADEIKENTTEKSETSACEKVMRESTEGEKGEQLMCDDTNSKMGSHESALEKECTDSVDVKICDQKDSENSTLGKGDEVIASGGDGGVKDSVKPDEGEIRPVETSVVSSKGEHVGDGAQPEKPTDSSVDCESSTAQELVKLKEGNASPAVGGTSFPTENNSKSTSPSPVVQNDAPVANRPEPKRACGDVPPSAAVINSEPCGINLVSSCHGSTIAADDLAISNAPLTEEVDSSKDVKSQGSASPVHKMPVDKISEMHHDSDSQDMSPPALQIDMERDLNSRSCTPTQDEPPYDHEAGEDLQDNQSFEREPHPVNRSPPIKGSIPDRCKPTSSDMHICNSPGHKAQSFPQGTCWSARKYDGTEKVNDDGESSLISDHARKQNKQKQNFDREDVTPPRHLYSEEGELENDQFGYLSEQYEEQSSTFSSWTHGSGYKTDEPKPLREPYPCDEDAEGPLVHFRNNTSIHRELAQMPREATESDSGAAGWVHRFHYADSVPTVDESNERGFPFRHQADLSESNDPNSISYSKKKQKRTFYKDKWPQENFEEYSIKKTISCATDRTNTLRTVTSSSYQHKGESKQSFDWRRYFRREGIFDTKEGNDRFVPDPPSSIITVFDKKGNRAIFENPSTLKGSTGPRGVSPTLEDSFHNWEDQRSKSDITQSLMEQEYLVFSEKMNQLLKNCKAGSTAKSQHRPNLNPADNPMTIQFSRLDEQEGSVRFDETWPTLPKFKINVDMSERKVVMETVNYGKPLHLQSLFCERGNETASSKISDITKECAQSYSAMMSEVCTGKTTPRQHDRIKRKRDAESAAGSKQSAFCGRIKKAMFDNLHDNLNSIVRQACKIKYKFYILVTSADPFFEETKDLLEAEGHTAIEPYQFDFEDNDQTPLLVILRNEDIAEHICDVPHLLDLKKSSRVLFAGIDQPDDVVNLTHQELFAKGGFVVFDDTALDTLTLENMKKVVGIMEELDKKGKWKWFLHYRDNRKLRENARCSPEAQTRKHFVDCCQEAGIVEVLPYHECDVISRDRPDYLRCLSRLQIQNASARFPVFITDTPAESFGRNGILTMNIYTFSRILSNDTCSVS